MGLKSLPLLCAGTLLRVDGLQVITQENVTLGRSCTYTPRSGDFAGTSDSCVTGGAYTPSYYGDQGATEFHAGWANVGCLEFSLVSAATVEISYGREAAWSSTCPVNVYSDFTRSSNTAVSGTIIDSVDASTPGEFLKTFTSSTLPAGTTVAVCEGPDGSICGAHVDYITISAGAAPEAGASAVGDPHLQNVHGERFDLMREGRHVLINIPRGKGAEQALLRVQADARRLGGQCADMYFQELNVTGSWAEAEQAGGYHYSVSQSAVETPEWVALGKVELKVVHGRTDHGLRYLNVYVKHLAHAGFAVGGLLGEDDHEDVVTPPESCAKKVALVYSAAFSEASFEVGGKGPSVSSVAVADYA